MTEALPALQTQIHSEKVHMNGCMTKDEFIKLAAIDGALIFRKIEF